MRSAWGRAVAIPNRSSPFLPCNVLYLNVHSPSSTGSRWLLSGNRVGVGMRFNAHVGAVLCLAVMAGCSGGETTVTDTTGTEVGSEVGLEITGQPDILFAELGTDGPAPELGGETVPEVTVQELPQDTLDLQGCLTNEDCDSGYCVPGPNGKVCTSTCVEECPKGWVCKPVGAQPDSVSICVWPHLELCRPCKAHEDCKPGVWESADYCIPYGPQGSFCGVECGKSAPCPTGYSCKNVEVGEGLFADQCMLEAGECACTPEFVADGATTACSSANDAGTCKGERSCKGALLSACDAPVPATESCNGNDDDCDDEIDEGTGGSQCERTNEFGTCLGSYSCVAGQLACDAQEPAEDKCDGQDNDCDGVADQAFPDKDQDGEANCIDQDDDGDSVSDEEDNCPLAANPEQENFDLDSQGDACDSDDDNDLVPDDGDCGPFDPTVKPGAQEICDGLDNDCDGSTDEDFVCGTGPCAGKKEGDACDDGDACTGSDTCAGGACIGTPKDCTYLDGPCTTGVCKAGACQQEAKAGTCDDADPCTVDDSCQQGSCLGIPMDCTDLDGPCSHGICLNGGCIAQFLMGACSDGDPCTSGDACKDGLCKGTAKDCSYMDGTCTKGTCSDGACVQDPLEGPCDDQDPATADDACAQGVCAGLPDPDGDGIANSGYAGPCKSGKTDGCNDNCPLAPNADQADADGNGVGDACTCVPSCAGKQCGSDGCGGSCGTCDDKDPCTVDMCQPAGTCSAAAGNNGAICTLAGGCSGKCDSGKCLATASELCNNQDDDCDGKSDEDFPLKGSACDSDDLDQCKFGTWTCKANGSGLECPSELFTNLSEACNNQDDDCDGQTDEGTLCPANYACSAGACVPTCQAVNGGWTDWSCGSCSAPCDGGTQTCTRSCTNPPPSCGGSYCSGSASQTQSCNTQPCINYLPTGTTTYSQGEQVITGVVPSGKYSITFKLWGGGGGGGAPGGGGGGAFVQGTLSVQPGDNIELRVAGGGAAENGGGGATYVFKNGSVVLVAAGGGGGGSDGCSGCHKTTNPNGGQGGGGGALGSSGETGTPDNTYNCFTNGGQGASASSGGSGGTVNNQSGYSSCTVNGNPGTSHTGGKNTVANCSLGNAASYHKGGTAGGANGSGGGGGSGYYGGGGGGAMYTYNGGGGGGGSSWVAAGVSGTNSQAGAGRNPGGTGISGYQGEAGRGGQGETDWPNPAFQSTPGNPGLIVMTM